LIRREESRHDFAFMAGVVIGAVAGALATLALAPRTGTETRDRWRSRVDEMQLEEFRAKASSLREVAATRTDQLREAANSAATSDVLLNTRSRVTDFVDRSPIPVTFGDKVAEESDDLGDSLISAAEEGQRAAENFVEEADTVLEESATRVAEAVDDDSDDESNT
jgi:gas vesicle protein